MPDETVVDNNVPAKAEAPLTIKADILPERAYSTQRITDPLPPALIERVGQLMIDDKQAEILTAPVDDEEIDIRPDGFIYVSHEYCRRQLNAAFKPLGWSMVEASPLMQRPGTNEWYQKWCMIIGGVFAGVTMASRQLHDRNEAQDLSDVYESIKSDCLRRICKDLGLGIEAWNKRRQKEWRDKYAKRVRCRNWKGESIVQWRRIDADPLPREQGDYTEVPETTDGKRPEQRPPQQAASPQQGGPAREAQPKPEATKPPEPKASDGPRPASGGGMKILPAQERMIFARLRNAQLLVGEDAAAAMEFLSNEMDIELIQDDGKTSAENLAAMIKQLPANRVTDCAKKLDAIAKGAN